MNTDCLSKLFTEFDVKRRVAFCPKHGSFKAYMPKEDVEPSYYCPKCQEEAESLILEANAQEQMKKVFLGILSDSGVPDNFLNVEFTRFEITNDTQRFMYNRVSQFISGIYRTLTLIGTPGVGKTHLMCAAIKELTQQGKKCLYVTEAEIVRQLKETFNKTSKTTEEMVIQRYVSPDVLCIDELRGTEWAQWDGIVLADIIDRRWQKYNKQTMLSGNISIEQLKSHFEDRTLSRLQDHGDIIKCISEDYRKRWK